MKLHFTVLLTCFCILNVAAQKNKLIRGVAKDSRNQPLPGATVHLLKLADSAIVQTKVTGERGKFEFDQLPDGTFMLSVTAIGYKRYVSPALQLSDSNTVIAMPAIILLPEKGIDLQELVIKSKQPLIVQDIDKTIVNAGAMIGTATSNTLEVLAKTPGVMVGSDGDISLNGKPGVLVLIDGRPTYMSGNDLATYLKSLPGALLDKIELMDNPPAKYDAAGSAIINIRLKKSRKGGVTGNISSGYSQSVYARQNDAASLNFNTKKISVTGNLGYYKEDNYFKDTYDRKFYNADGGPKAKVVLTNNQRYSSNGVDIRAGVDFMASANTSYGILVNLNQNKRHTRLNYTSNSYDATGIPDSNGIGNTIGNNDRTNIGLNLNFLHKFNDQGRELSADANYLSYNSQGGQVLNNYIFLPGAPLPGSNEFMYQLPADIKIYTLKADYAHPLQNKAAVEAGIKSSFVSNDNDSRYFNVFAGNNLPDYGRSNHFIYHENIHAAYINARKNWKKLRGQLGLRLEHTQVSGDQLGNAATSQVFFKRNYTGVFPTAYLSYRLDSSGKNTLITSFARRINRPNYQQLNPFLFFRDNYSYGAGNPLLNPQYQYRLELRYQHKQNFGAGLQYMKATNIVFQTTEAKDGIFITRPENVSSGYMVILANNFSCNPVKWWTINTSILLAHMQVNGTVYGEKLNNGTNTWKLTVTDQFDLRKGWSGELTGYYTGKDIQGQTIVQPRYRLFAAMQKKILKDKASIRITAEDIFHLWIPKDNSVSIKQVESYHWSESDTQRLGIAFTWSFGKESQDRKRKHADNAADAEKGRVD